MTSEQESKYMALRHKAEIVPENAGLYDLSIGECNPAIFVKFCHVLTDSSKDPVTVWEPFAGHTVGGSRTQYFVSEFSTITLTSYDICPSDTRVLKRDSTQEGPGIPVTGVYFHPPYFGSWFSLAPGEVGLATTFDEYVAKLTRTVQLALQVKGGKFCAIGRHYLRRGQKVDISKVFYQILLDNGYNLLQVWNSVPDVILIAEKL